MFRAAFTVPPQFLISLLSTGSQTFVGTADERGVFEMFRVLGVVLAIAIAAGLAAVAYNVGVNTGFNVAVQQALQAGQEVPVVPYGYGLYGHGGGIGFFGIFFWIIGFFLLIGLIRAVFGFGRGGRGGWGRPGHGPGSYSGWGYGARGEAIADMHRELHRQEESGETDKSTGPPTSGS